MNLAYKLPVISFCGFVRYQKKRERQGLYNRADLQAKMSVFNINLYESRNLQGFCNALRFVTTHPECIVQLLLERSSERSLAVLTDFSDEFSINRN